MEAIKKVLQVVLNANNAFLEGRKKSVALNVFKCPCSRVTSIVCYLVSLVAPNAGRHIAGVPSKAKKGYQARKMGGGGLQERPDACKE